MDGGITYKTTNASAVDIEQHLSICKEAFTPPLSERVNIAAYAQKIFANAVTFEGWRNKDLIGLIAAYENVENQCSFITNVSVLPLFNGKGIAAALLQACIKHSKQMGIKLIKLEVNNRNEPVIKFYEKHGFFQSGTKDNMLIMHYNL